MPSIGRDLWVFSGSLRRDPCALPEEHLQLPGPHLEDDRECDVRGRGAVFSTQKRKPW